jgi:hypothetical protein
LHGAVDHCSAGQNNSLLQWFPYFFPDYLKDAECLGEPLMVFLHCAIGLVAKDVDKEAGTVLSLFHKHLGTSALLVYVFLILLCVCVCV